MSWEIITTLTVSREWQVSPPVVGAIFRIRHLTLPYGEGLISQALLSGSEISIFDVRLTYANIEPEIFSFVSFAGMVDRRIAIKSLVQDAVPWMVAIERYVLEDNPSDHPVLFGDFSVALAAKADLTALTAALATKADRITLTAQTSNATLTEMVNPQRILIHANSSAGYEIYLTGHSTAATPEFIYWIGSGALYRGAAASSTILQTATGTRRSSLGNGTNWTPTVSADTVNGGLKIQVKGDVGKVIKWVASIQLTEVW